MPALNFQDRFADAIALGTKRQTLRAPRKRPIRVGDLLHLYVGQRQRGAARKLRLARCTAVATVTLCRPVPGSKNAWLRQVVTLDGKRLSPMQALSLANRDGFGSASEMLAFFERLHGLPFWGVLIHW